MSESQEPQTLRRFWKEQSTSAPKDPGLKIGISATFTVEPLVPYLGSLLIQAGEAGPVFQIADYNQVASVCLNPVSFFDKPDVILLLWRIDDLTPDFKMETVREATETLLGAVEQLRNNFQGTIVVGLPPRPGIDHESIVHFARPSPLMQFWHETVARMAATICKAPLVYSVDLDNILSTLGQEQSLDHRKEFVYRQPFTERFYVRLGDAIARMIRARRGLAKKCLVLDCDNTLWGGILGDDGIGGIQIGQDFPGSAYFAFQKACLALKESGVFLAISSKNDADLVLEVFRTHDAMLLKESDISVFRVNWNPKSQSLNEIASELNIGMDSLVLVDDSRFEMEEVQSRSPDVVCLKIPEEIADLPYLLNTHRHLFERLEVTQEDLHRVDRQKKEAARKEVQQAMTEAGFLASLDLKVYVYPPAQADLERVTQLINKTNQFNLTTRRYTHQQVLAFSKDQDRVLLAMSVEDKFGEYGLVGVAMAVRFEQDWEMDTLLMSCRVLKRSVESALLSAITQYLASREAIRLIGIHIPTRKNHVCSTLYEDHGFQPLPVESLHTPSQSPGIRAWSLEPVQTLLPPPHITLMRKHP